MFNVVCFHCVLFLLYRVFIRSTQKSIWSAVLFCHVDFVLLLAMFRAGAHTHQPARSKCNKTGAEQEQMCVCIREIENEHTK